MSVSEFVTPVRLENGVLKIKDRRHFDAGLKAMRNGEYLCRMEKAKATRSPDANKLYWVGYVGPMAAHTGETPMVLHQYFKQRFLPKSHLVIRSKDGVVLDACDVDALTTTTLTDKEFSDFLREIENLALEVGVRVGSNREDE